MPEARIDELLEQLCSRDSHEAWSAFLEQYASLILQVIRHFKGDGDDSADCFQFVCERLCEDRFRRLRRFKRPGPARFSTWLRAVIRNLCLDWQRKQFGRRRLFSSIDRLSELDQAVFRCVHEREASEQETLIFLAPRFPQLTVGLLAESVERINGALTKNQNWLLRARSATAARRPNDTSAIHEHAEVVDSRANPEVLAIIAERTTMLHRSLRRLSKQERLLIRLRFEEELTLEQIAKLLGLGNAQRVDRHIKQILSALRLELISVGVPDVSGRQSPSSVKAG